MTHIKTREDLRFFNEAEIEKLFESTNDFYIPMATNPFMPDISGVDYDRIMPNLSFFR